MATEVSQPRYRVRHVRDVRVPLPDGAWLAADLFVPESIADLVGAPHPLAPPSSRGKGARRPAAAERFPALLEYLPYRKNDSSASRWDAHHYFAARGYVGVRLDVRGTGDSPGVARDEYTPQEQLDGCAAIAWLAAQPWCTGRVGMWGTSYGGFNAIQVAMHNPPALKAIAPHAATDDRYTDDVHYYGGCLTAIDQLPYPLRMVAMNALPPSLELPDWEALWRERLDGAPWMLEWPRHQVKDAYWRQGSLSADYAAIRCPVFHVGGWNDGYTNAVFRMLEHLRVPNKALVGPWTHARPNACAIGPRVDFLHEVLRWWDYWLKDIDTGIMDEPPITLYVQQSHPPARWPAEIPGHWRYETEWPPRRQRTQTLYLAGGGALRPEPAAGEGSDSYAYDPTIGTAAGFWCPSELPYGLAGDQRLDDARSLTYATAPLEAPLEILGTPRVVLHAASTAPVACFVAKLCDVAPDGASTLITRGALNATRRQSFEAPEPLRPGEVYELAIPLRVISWVVPAGHRLRLSVSSADWPLIWPPPYPATNRIHHGPGRQSRLLLPTIPADAPRPSPRVPQLRPPDPAAPPETARVEAGPPLWEVVRDELDGTVTVRVARASTTVPSARGIRLRSSMEVAAAVAAPHPEAACVRGDTRMVLEQSGERIEAAAQAVIQGTVEALRVDVTLDVTRNGAAFHHREWHESIPRHLL